MPPALPGLLLGPLLACGSGQEVLDDAERYREVVTAADLDTARGVAACGAIADPDLRGDCVVFVAGRRGVDDPVPAATLCAVAPPGLWQDECWFVTAEAARRARRRQEAAAACLQAGAFKHDCGQHLWQSEVRAVVAPSRAGVAPPSFEEALPRAMSVYSRWAPLLEEGTDMSERFWRRFYQNGFERAGWIDLARCLPLDEEQRARCEDAGAKLVWARIDLDLRQAGIDPCTLDQGVEPVASRLRVAPHPALDQALEEWQARRCDRGPGPEVP